MIKNKRAEGYIRTCLMILIFCIAIAVFMSFLNAIHIVRISKQNTYKVIDGFVTLCSIDAFNSIKVGSDYIEHIDTNAFESYFEEYNGLEQSGTTLISKTDSGYEKYRLTDLSVSFVEENTLKMQVDYTLTIPIKFGNIAVANATVPISVKSKLTDKFS